MTEQILYRLFDFQRFARSTRLDGLIRDTQARHAATLSEKELSFVNAAGTPEIMGLLGGESEDKDDPWNQH